MNSNNQNHSKNLGHCVSASLVKVSFFLPQVTIYARVVFLKLGEIDTVAEKFNADAFIQARWREPNLDGQHMVNTSHVSLISHPFLTNSGPPHPSPQGATLSHRQGLTYTRVTRR